MVHSYTVAIDFLPVLLFVVVMLQFQDWLELMLKVVQTQLAALTVAAASAKR